MKVAWESLCTRSAEHEAVIAELMGREVTLQSTLDQKEARVLELESLLQCRDLGNSVVNQSVLNAVMGLEILKSDLERTREDYANSCDEVSRGRVWEWRANMVMGHFLVCLKMEEVQHRLQTAVQSLVERLQLLHHQVWLVPFLN